MIGESRSMPGGGTMSAEQIERELARLRMNEDGTLGARASVLNLIAVTDEESAGNVTGIISELSGHYPSRAIVMISDPDEEEASLDFGLSAFCSIRGGGGNQVCAEQITVHVQGSPADHLESLAGPLLVPDLPVFLWYPNGDIPRSPECGGMAALADRLVLDSSAADECEAFLRGVANLVEDCVLSVGDLQWAALSPWRSLVAHLFAPPERARELEKIERVEILHTPDGECRALLFTGWLSAALGWRPESAEHTGEGRVFRFIGPSGDVTAELAPSAEAALRRVRLHSEELAFQVLHHEEHADVHSTVMRGDELLGERAVHLGSSDQGVLLGEELRILDRDETYESALKRAVEMLDA
jgi:glucose-6-phosphate dehydrogenase assembly protein OpcA